MDDSEKSICFIDKLVRLVVRAVFSLQEKGNAGHNTTVRGFNRDSKFDICWQEEKLKLM